MTNSQDQTALSTPTMQGNGLKILILMACLIIIGTGLKLAASLFIPIMLGMFLAVLSMPILRWLIHLRAPRGVAVALTVGVNFLVLGAILLIAYGVIVEFQEQSSEYLSKFRVQAAEFSDSMDDQIERMVGFWNDSVLRSEADEDDPFTDPSLQVDEGFDTVFPDPHIPTFREIVDQVLDEVWDSEKVLQLLGATDAFGRLTSFTSKAFFALIIMIFLLAESGQYAAKVRSVLKARGPNLGRLRNSGADIQKYLAIKTGASAATGILAMLTCIIFKVDFPVLWGLVAFFFNYVPAIGSILAGIPPILLALVLSGFWPAAGVLSCYLAINIAIGNFIEPMFLGDRFGLSTVVVILSVMVWGFIWGPVGMLLAVPLTMVVKVMLDNSEDFRWISALMGSRKKKDTIPPATAPVV